MSKEAPLLTTAAAAEYLGLSPRTLEAWRLRGSPFPYVKLGSRCLYRRADLEAHLDANLRRSTADPGPAAA